MMKNKKKMILLDGQGMIYRSFYALPPLTTSGGRVINAVYGFTTMLIKLLEQEKPDYIMVALDMPVPTFRHKKYKEYKAHRKKMPGELIEQIPLIKQVIKKYNICICEKEGYEADDIIGTIAKKADSNNYEILIVTGDRDAFQLISSNIKVMMMVKGITETKIMNADDILIKYGITPDKMIDIMALKGDASDNIPGVPGIGEKTAVSLIKEFGSLDDILKNIDQIPNKSIMKKIKENISLITLSKELATIDLNVPMEYDFEAFKTRLPDYEELWKIFKELEFGNLLKKIEPSISREERKIEYQIIDSQKKFDKLLKVLNSSEKFAYYFLKPSEKMLLAEVLGLAISLENNENYYIPLCPINLIDTINCLSLKNVISKIAPLFEERKVIKIGYDIKKDHIIFKKNGIQLAGNNHDIMIAAYLLNPSSGKYKIEDILWEYLKYSQRNDVEDYIKKIEYACEIAQSIYRLKNILEEKLENKKMFSLFREIEMPLVQILANMEIHGVKIDSHILGQMDEKLKFRLEKLQKVIYHLADAEFNINSPKQLSVILFEKLKLPIIKKTKTGYSTNSDVLNALAPKHKIISSILEFRELEKLKNTYISKLPLLIDPKTNRIHTFFHQTIAATGRLSSSEPNLQNIPIRTEIGREIRKAFVAEKNNLLLSADYSQVELRILAHLSKDERLVKAFSNNEDIHAHTASAIFGIDQDLVNYKMRRMAKIINFGIIYGMSAYGLARNLAINRIEAEKFIIQYFYVYRGVKEYIEAKKEEARKKGYVLTLLNRRRYIPEINHKNKNIREFNERIAINTPIQGTAADLIKIAMISIDKEFNKRQFQSKMILQIHDELIFEMDKNELKEAQYIVKEIMENSLKLSVPLKTNLKTGKNWAELN